MLRKDPFITGEYYHIYNRGIDKRIIFKSNKDYERFIILLYISNMDEQSKFNEIINRKKKKFNEIFEIKKNSDLVSIGAWCLMPNHFHLLLRQNVEGGITKFMRKVGVGYSMFFNIKYDRKGALFGGLFKSKLIGTDDNYMRQLFAYIHLNPLELEFPDWEENIKTNHTKEMKNFLESYPYSSYQDYLGLKNRGEENILKKDDFPEYFPKVSDFKDFVENYFIK